MSLFNRNDQTEAFKKLNPHLFGRPTPRATALPPGFSGKTVAQPPKPAKSPLSALFEELWQAAGGPPLTPEWRFHQTRNWRYDYALPDRKFAIELEGITKQGGRHQRKAGFEGDTEKYLESFLAGWVCVRLTRSLLTPENISKIILAIPQAVALKG